MNKDYTEITRDNYAYCEGAECQFCLSCKRYIKNLTEKEQQLFGRVVFNQVPFDRGSCEYFELIR